MYIRNIKNLSKRFKNTAMGIEGKTLSEEKFYKGELFDFQEIIKVDFYEDKPIFLTKNGEVYHDEEKVLGLKGEKIIDIKTSLSEKGAFLLSESGNIYSWGKNECGILGLGHNNSVSNPERIKHLEGNKVIQIEIGHFHCLALTDDGRVYAWGNNNYGKLGLGHVFDRYSPQFVASFKNKKIIQVQVGRYCSYALCENGNVYSWGENIDGILGIDYAGGYFSSPQPIKELEYEDVVQIAAGSMHCLALTNHGKVYGFGINGAGQLGFDSCSISRKLTPVPIPELKKHKVVRVFASNYHSIIITKEGELYAWGANANGELGCNNFIESYKPILVNVKN